jgi:hypothetical protein
MFNKSWLNDFVQISQITGEEQYIEQENLSHNNCLNTNIYINKISKESLYDNTLNN